MLADFTGILVILVAGFAVVGAMLGIHLLLGPRRKFPEKNEPFECGESPIVSPHQRYAVKFYMVAILFVVFDVEDSMATSISRLPSGQPMVLGIATFCRSVVGWLQSPIRFSNTRRPCTRAGHFFAPLVW